MGFYGKKKIKEIEAAGQFVMAIMRDVQEYWLSASARIELAIPLRSLAAGESVGTALVAVRILSMTGTPRTEPRSFDSELRTNCAKQTLSLRETMVAETSKSP